jgi:uncharacterized protein YkwD
MLKRLYLPVLIVIPFVVFKSTLAQVQCGGGGIFASATCGGDEVSDEERELFDIVNSFRSENGKPALRLSKTLSMVGNRRMLDLTQNMRSLTHSWSNCPYEIGNEKTWTCMMDSPVRLKSGYKGTGYETLYATGSKKVDPKAAIAAWKKSSLHTSIILGTGMFASMSWDEFGVAISGGYATLWFGQPGDGETRGLGEQLPTNVVDSLKSAFDASESGNSRLIRWSGKSSVGRIRIEVDDRNLDFYSAEVRLSMAITPAGIVSPNALGLLKSFLRKAYPEWNDSAAWLDSALGKAASLNFERRIKLTDKSAIEVDRSGSGEITISIFPKSKTKGLRSF